MKKITLTIIIAMLWLNISCGGFKSAINTPANGPATSMKAPSGNIPSYIKNAKPDTHAAEASSIVVRVDSDETTSPTASGLLINGERYPIDTGSEQLKKLLEKTPAERQLIYLDASRDLKISTIARVVDMIRMGNVENFALVVQPEGKKGVSFDILKVKVLPKPDMYDETPSTDLSKRTYVNMSKDGKINFARYDAKTFELKPEKEEIKSEELEAKIKELLSKGTGETDKRIFIKGSRSLLYDQIAKMIDAATGAGAEVYFVIDDLTE